MVTWTDRQRDREQRTHRGPLLSRRLPFSFLNQLGLSIDISLPIIIDLVIYFLVFISLSGVPT